jgi:6-pyruvoyl-tetrahydropterin synthase
VTVGGDVHVLDESSSEGMVIDFDDLKVAWAPLDEYLDHRLLNDVLDVPTAERIAMHIFGLLSSSLPGTQHLRSVRVWETPTSYAEVTP